MTDYFVVEPCATSSGFEIKLQGRRIDLKRAEKALVGLGETVASSPVVLLAKVKGYSLSVYASGRMLVKDDDRLGEEEATELAKEIIAAFEREEAIA
jgi:hypothetical protein